MDIAGAAKRVTIYVGDSQRWHREPLHTALVKMLRQNGLAGATVIQGVEGFGRSSRIHTASIMRLSDDLPVIITFIDTPDRVEQVLPLVDEMVNGGLVVVEDVHVRVYSEHDADRDAH